MTMSGCGLVMMEVVKRKKKHIRAHYQDKKNPGVLGKLKSKYFTELKLICAFCAACQFVALAL